MNFDEKVDYSEYYIIKPEIEGSDENDILRITKKAMSKIEELIEEKEVPEHFYLRTGLRGGGIEGTKFYLEFDYDVNDNDLIFDVKDIQIIIDSRSMFYMLGFIIDYIRKDDSNENGFILTGWKKIPAGEQ